MATTSEIAEVRENVDEPNDKDWDDQTIGDLVDSNGINGTSAIIWRKKASKYSALVNVSEAGSSHSFSDLQKNALAMEKRFIDLAAKDNETTTYEDRPKVKVIERAYRE